MLPVGNECIHINDVPLVQPTILELSVELHALDTTIRVIPVEGDFAFSLTVRHKVDGAFATWAYTAKRSDVEIIQGVVITMNNARARQYMPCGVSVDYDPIGAQDINLTEIAERRMRRYLAGRHPKQRIEDLRAIDTKDQVKDGYPSNDRRAPRTMTFRYEALFFDDMVAVAQK